MTALEQEIAECPDCKSMRGLGGQQCTGHQLLWQRVRIAELEAQLAAQSLDTKESGYQAELVAVRAERNRSEHEPCPVCGHALLYLDDHYECDECVAKFDSVTTAITIHKDIKSQLATVTAERDRLAAENGMFKMGFHEAKQQEEKP